VETDVSDFAAGAVLFQYSENNKLNPRVFISKDSKKY